MTGAIVGHLVGDYLAQNDWMALNKKAAGWHGLLACAVHCTLWTAAVLMFSGWYALPRETLAWLIPSLWLTHFAQDRTKIINGWMWLIGQSKFSGPPLGPWSIIVVDNVWHIVTLWAIDAVLRSAA